MPKMELGAGKSVSPDTVFKVLRVQWRTSKPVMTPGSLETPGDREDLPEEGETGKELTLF